MAWWAEGVHNAGLGRWGLACESFQSALDAAKDDARENGAPETVGPDSSFSVNIASGWLEFARWRNGDSTSYDRFPSDGSILQTDRSRRCWPMKL